VSFALADILIAAENADNLALEAHQRNFAHLKPDRGAGPDGQSPLQALQGLARLDDLAVFGSELLGVGRPGELEIRPAHHIGGRVEAHPPGYRRVAADVAAIAVFPEQGQRGRIDHSFQQALDLDPLGNLGFESLLGPPEFEGALGHQGLEVLLIATELVFAVTELGFGLLAQVDFPAQLFLELRQCLPRFLRILTHTPQIPSPTGTQPPGSRASREKRPGFVGCVPNGYEAVEE